MLMWAVYIRADKEKLIEPNELEVAYQCEQSIPNQIDTKRKWTGIRRRLFLLLLLSAQVGHLPPPTNWASDFVRI